MNRRDFLKASALTGGGAVLASCAPAAGTGVAGPDLSTGASIPLDQLTAAAQAEGTLTTIALPHDWANYGEIIETYKSECGMQVNELNPDAGSADELEAIRANKEAKGPQAPDGVDVVLGYTKTAKNKRTV